jgi:hypothetical protein
MAFTMDNAQQVTATIPPIVDRKGRPAEIDNPPVWNISDDTIAEIIPSEDGMSALIKARGPAGSVTISAEGDADLGDGVTPIFWVGTGTITPGAAVGGEIGFSAPEDQPAEEPPVEE